MWCLHQVRFFVGPTKGNVSQQRLLVESFVNSMTHENNARQRRGKAPMGAEEAMKEARRLCTTSGLDAALLNKGDVYGENTKAGARQGYQGGSSGNGNGHRNGRNQQGDRNPRGGNTTRDKVNKCCKIYNEGKECRYGQACRNSHQCSWVDRDTGRVCWEAHPKCNHQAIKNANNPNPNPPPQPQPGE